MVDGRYRISSHRAGDRTDRHERDRGQVILIGAIALAFIILGLVVVFNGVIYTETLAPSSAGQSASDANTVEYELERGIGGIAHRGNLREWDDNYESRLRDVIDDNYETHYRTVTATSRSSIVSLGSVTVAEPATVKTDHSVSSSSVTINRQVGHLEFDLESDSDGGSINVTDTVQGRSVIIREAIVDGSDGFEVEDESGTVCRVSNDRARINLVTGAINATTSGSCDRTLLDPSDTANLVVDGESDAAGTYDIVVEGSGSLPTALGSSSDGAWTVDVEVTYESNEASYERTQTISVYGDSP